MEKYSNISRNDLKINRISFLGYPVDYLNFEDTLGWIENCISSKRSNTVAVLNANKLWLARRDKHLSDFIHNAELIIPEYAVVWGARMLDQSLNHIGGIMLLKAFLPFAEKKRIRPYFLGARAEIISKMIANISIKYPLIEIAGFHHGYISNANTKKKVIKDIENSNPAILFVAMGSPKQEYLISELKQTLNIPVLMGVGGSFDVLSGNKKDAPPWARSKGLEWFFRIIQEPKNTQYLKRYLITNTWFVWQVIKEKICLNNCTSYDY